MSNIISSSEREAAALKKALEWELSLESRDMKSHAWYHGYLTRQRAEEIVLNESDFLVRDCTSQANNYVLTCRSKNAVLHFVINKILLQPETVYERIQYQFEDDAFDTVPDLITYYVGSGKEISAASGARIKYPCNRTYPLSFYGHKIIGNQLHEQMLAGTAVGGRSLCSPLGGSGCFQFNIASSPSQAQTQDSSPINPSPRIKLETISRLPFHKPHFQGHPVQLINNEFLCKQIVNIGVCDEVHELRSFNTNGSCRFGGRDSSAHSSFPQLEQFCSSNIHLNGLQTIARTNLAEVFDQFKFTTHSLPRTASNPFRGSQPTVSKVIQQINSNPLSPIIKSESKQTLDKLSQPFGTHLNRVRPRIATLKENIKIDPPNCTRQCAQSYHTSGSDSGNGSGDSLPNSISGDFVDFAQHRGVIIKNPKFFADSLAPPKAESAVVEELLVTMNATELKLETKFDVDNFSTLLLPSVENKPLDGEALCAFKMMLLENGSRIISEHLTRIDINLLIEELTEEERDKIECCGLELMTLPEGKIFRNDLIERTQCIKLLVAVTLLTCQTDLDRAELLNKWIQIAIDTKTALGNLYGFSAIMLGLCMPQIQKLDNSWHILRQKFTDNAFMFESKLRPTLNHMNECTNPQAPNTTVPYVIPYILLRDLTMTDIINSTSKDLEKSSLYKVCVTPWENKADDFGMFIYFQHFESVRMFLKNLDLYRKNSRILLEDLNLHYDELLSDAFRTEFHIKFLWGSTCALATPDDRHSKLEKVLTLMADKFYSANTTGTPN